MIAQKITINMVHSRNNNTYNNNNNPKNLGKDLGSKYSRQPRMTMATGK